MEGEEGEEERTMDTVESNKLKDGSCRPLKKISRGGKHAWAHNRGTIATSSLEAQIRKLQHELVEQKTSYEKQVAELLTSNADLKKVNSSLKKLTEMAIKDYSTLEITTTTQDLVLKNELRLLKSDMEEQKTRVKNQSKEVKQLEEIIERKNAEASIDSQVTALALKQIIGEKLEGYQENYKKQVKELNEKMEKLTQEATDAALAFEDIIARNIEERNSVVWGWGEKRREKNLKTHVEILELFGCIKRNGLQPSFALEENCLFLEKALINFGYDFLKDRGFKQIDAVRNDMNQWAQRYPAPYLDEEDNNDEDDESILYFGRGFPINDKVQSNQLPLRYSALSKHKMEVSKPLGEMLTGSFTVLEQLAITMPDGNMSRVIHGELLTNLRDFYVQLNLPHQILSSLDTTNFETLDIEAWFPAEKSFKKIVSCTNGTDELPRRMDLIQGNQREKKYCHLLLSPIIDTYKTISCLLETYQFEGGVVVPEVLRPYMYDMAIIPYPSRA